MASVLAPKHRPSSIRTEKIAEPEPCVDALTPTLSSVDALTPTLSSIAPTSQEQVLEDARQVHPGAAFTVTQPTSPSVLSSDVAMAAASAHSGDTASPYASPAPSSPRRIAVSEPHASTRQCISVGKTAKRLHGEAPRRFISAGVAQNPCHPALTPRDSPAVLGEPCVAMQAATHAASTACTAPGIKKSRWPAVCEASEGVASLSLLSARTDPLANSWASLSSLND